MFPQFFSENRVDTNVETGRNPRSIRFEQISEPSLVEKLELSKNQIPILIEVWTPFVRNGMDRNVFAL